jgi:hypothetical protein
MLAAVMAPSRASRRRPPTDPRGPWSSGITFRGHACADSVRRATLPAVRARPVLGERGLSKVAMLVGLGYLLGVPAALWCRHDLGRFRRPLWVGYGNRDAWRRSLALGLVALGWGAVFVALGWRTGRTRQELLAELDRMPAGPGARGSDP